jgi:hypothetical protein
MPYGLIREDSPFNTRIDLPVAGEAICRLAINRRCLLEFARIYSPYVVAGGVIEGGKDMSGQVTVTGTIEENGATSSLVVVEARADPSARRSVLVDAAMRNLNTWRFEPSRRKDKFRLTYHFDLTDSPPSSGSDVQIRLPDEVRIITGRSRK